MKQHTEEARGQLFASSAQKPIYARIQDNILEDIRNGTWSAGDRIPTERAMADLYKASVGTVRHALQGLVAQGYLTRTQGKGTFVASSSEHVDTLRYYRFSHGFGQEVSALAIRSLAKPTLVTSSEAAEKMKLEKSAQFFKYDRLFLLDSKPVVFVSSYLPEALFPGFEKVPVMALDEIPLYLFIENKYSMPTLATKDGFSAVAADANSSRLLKVEKGFPLLRIEMLAMTTRNVCYEYRVSYCVTDNRQIIRD